MRNFLKLTLTALLFMAGQALMAQGASVTGKVIDEDGFEVIGANVLLKGQSGVGTVTNIDGLYELQVGNPQKDVLVFSYVGMEPQEIAIKGKSVINVTLKTSAIALEEVVAIGYGTSRRKDITGSVSSVKGAELMSVPTADVSSALAGRIAGVQIQSADGAPGSEISIRVRGGISITQSNEPLYIIDGFPSEDGLSTLDPADIESIDVLKDASATAIYGSRGANGVVVVTTKQGAADNGQVRVSFDAYFGVKKLAKTLDVLSPAEFVYLDYERTGNGEEENEGFVNRYGEFQDISRNYDNRAGIDWQDATLGRTATSQNYRLGIAGGNKDLKYKLGYAFFDDEGAMVFSGSKKHNISLNLSHKANDRLSVSGRVVFDQWTVQGMGTADDNGNFNKMNHILAYRPTAGIMGDDETLLGDEDPLLVDDSGNVMQNPLISAEEEHRKRETRTLQTNGGLSFRILKNLTFRNATGMRYQTRRDELFYGARSIMAKRSSIQGSIRNSEYGSFQTSNTLNYELKKKRHNMSVLLGQEYVTRWNRWFQASASNFPNDDIGLGDMSQAATPGIPDSYQSYDDKLLSFFARVNYSYRSRYLFTATVRADGSSKFGDNNKWGYFPSVSGAWRIVEEDFIKDLDVFSDLKLRVGYGMAGNNRISSYGSLSILGSVSYPDGLALGSGYSPIQIPNADLKWESNNTFNVGLDFGFFNQRLTFAPEFYINNSHNLLLQSKIPASSGYQIMLRNIGKTRNTGVDLAINSTNIQNKDFTWSTSLNISHNNNKIVALAGEQFFLEEARFGFDQKNFKVAVDAPLGQMYGYVTEGLYQVEDFNYDEAKGTYTLKDGVPYHGDKTKIQPGNWKFKNLNDDDKINEADKTIIGEAQPLFYGGLNNTFSYKGFDMSVFFTFSYGGEIFNATKLTNVKAGRTNKNALDCVNSSNRWITVNAAGEKVSDPTTLAAMNAGKTVAAWYDMEDGDEYIHSWAVEDASFLRLSNVTLGYTFPKQWIKKAYINSLRLYATGNNLFCWTPYTGIDPEVSTRGNAMTPNVDYGAYPKSRSFVVGINVTF